MNLSRPSTCAAALSLAGLLSAAAYARAEDCYRPPSPVESLDYVRENLVLQTARSSYVLADSCLVVRRKTFGTTLSFVILNRFPADTAVKDAYVLIKSVRILSSAPPIKISLSRGDGWFLPGKPEQKPAVADSMSYEPFSGSTESWNAAHQAPGTPPEINAKLQTQWHAYATSTPGDPSTVPIGFFKVDGGFDQAHGVQTNYLIRFSVNTGSTMSKIPFQVYVQRQVQQVELTLLSNIDALSGTYKFVIQ